MNGFEIAGWGAYLPDKVLSNDELAERFGVDNEWIYSRCGISERRIVGPGETTASMAIEAGKRALDKAGLTGADVAHLILATGSPEQPQPASSAFVHHGLGIAGSAHDVDAECTGFLYALLFAAGMMTLDPRPILIVGSDTHSLVTDPTDRDLSILVGDGAGAVVLTPSPDNWLQAFNLGADGKYHGSLKVVAGGSRMPPTVENIQKGLHYAKINGNEIYLNAVRFTVRSVKETLASAKVAPDEVDHVLPHQANIRIINSILNHTKIPEDRLISNLHRYGNTASASMPIALTEAMEEGRVRNGDLLLLAGFGAGMTWGSALLKWGGEST